MNPNFFVFIPIGVKTAKNKPWLSASWSRALCAVSLVKVWTLGNQILNPLKSVGPAFCLLCVKQLSMMKVPWDKVNDVICDKPELTHFGEWGCSGINLA